MTNLDNATHLPRVTQPFGLPRRSRPWRDALAKAIRVIATRRRLATMEDHLLADIGISRGEALHESRRKPWDIETQLDPSRQRWTSSLRNP